MHYCVQMLYCTGLYDNVRYCTVWSVFCVRWVPPGHLLCFPFRRRLKIWCVMWTNMASEHDCWSHAISPDSFGSMRTLALEFFFIVFFTSLISSLAVCVRYFTNWSRLLKPDQLASRAFITCKWRVWAVWTVVTNKQPVWFAVLGIMMKCVYAMTDNERTVEERWLEGLGEKDWLQSQQ